MCPKLTVYIIKSNVHVITTNSLPKISTVFRPLRPWDEPGISRDTSGGFVEGPFQTAPTPTQDSHNPFRLDVRPTPGSDVPRPVPFRPSQGCRGCNLQKKVLPKVSNLIRPLWEYRPDPTPPEGRPVPSSLCSFGVLESQKRFLSLLRVVN